jgi:K+-transporting ATPase ATPase C chain
VNREVLIAIRMTLVTLVLTGVLYPVAMTVVAQGLFPRQANGSLVTAEHRVVGSALIAQRFSSAGYFHGRPSAAGASGYDASASGGSNLGATSKKLRDRVAADCDSLLAQNPAAPGPIPVDLVTASGSGLDPHVSLEAALWQAPRIATARGIPLESVQAMIRDRTEEHTLGLLGDPRVNVLLLNLDLDARYGRQARAGP